MECTSNRKIGKLRNLLRYAKIVSSNKALLNEEIRSLNTLSIIL